MASLGIPVGRIGAAGPRRRRGATATAADELCRTELEFAGCSTTHPLGRRMGRPKTREDVMKRVYHTMHFDVHDEKALHEFVRKHADPEEFAAMEAENAGHAEEAGDPVEHVYSDVEWIVENGHDFD